MKLFSLTFLVLLILLSACAARPVAPTPTITSPVAAATEHPPSPIPAVETPTSERLITAELELLQSTSWQWTSFTSPVEQYSVENPQNYLVTFGEDGSVAIQADCNMAGGTYTTEDKSLTIQLGPMTLAACPSGSLSEDFINYLGFSAIYFFEDGNLLIDMMADGGTMQFTPSNAVEDDFGLLTETPWQWISFTNPVEKYDIENSQDYLLNFNEDGSVNIKADCNNAVGTYSTDGSSLKIEIGPMTMAACPSDSRSDQFVLYLGSSALYFFETGNLFIDLFADGGTMGFEKAPLDNLSSNTETGQDTRDTELVEILGNLTYDGVFDDQPVKLTDGYAYYDDGSSGSPFVHLMDNLIGSGDLNEDGTEDAVAFLVDYTTGSGDFVYIVAVLNALNEPISTKAHLIGDRIPVKSLVIDGTQVVAELIAPGPGDAACCPTMNTRKIFGLEGNQLVERSSEVLGKVSVNDLNGTSWQLVDLNQDQEPVLPETEITLRFDDGQISGSAGCNNYNASLTGDEALPQTFIVSPIASTKKICPDPISNQETEYINRLENVVAWRYAFGNLSLTYKLAENVFGELVFEPQ